jgi:hypothetical protein
MIFGANIPLANATGIVEMMAIVEIRSGPRFPSRCHAPLRSG